MSSGIMLWRSAAQIGMQLFCTHFTELILTVMCISDSEKSAVVEIREP